METFSALLAICVGNLPVPGEFPAQRPVTRSFDVFFDLRLNKRLGKQSWGWWFETLSRPLWRHPNHNAILRHHGAVSQVCMFCKFNTMGQRQNGCHFATDDILTFVFLYENCRSFIQTSLQFVPKGLIYNKPAFVQKNVWRRSGNKPTHVWVTRPR